MMDLNVIATKHYDWVERMGWHNKTVLESLALIASEIGEAAEECVGGLIDQARFSEELADILLRCLDLAKTEGVNVEEQVSRARQDLVWLGNTDLEHMAEILVVYARWANTARQTPLGPDFAEGLGKVVARVLELAVRNAIDLSDVVSLKMAKNELRGSRGRRI